MGGAGCESWERAGLAGGLIEREDRLISTEVLGWPLAFSFKSSGV